MSLALCWQPTDWGGTGSSSESLYFCDYPCKTTLRNRLWKYGEGCRVAAPGEIPVQLLGL